MAFTALAVGGLIVAGTSAGVEANQNLQQRQEAHHNETQATELQQQEIDKQKQQEANQNAASASAVQSARAMQLRQLQAAFTAGRGIFTSPLGATGAATATPAATGGKPVLGI